MKVWYKKTSKQQILAMKTKIYRNQSIFFSYPIKAPCSTMIQWYSSLPLLLRYSSTKNGPIFYSNSNGDKNCVI
jgi:hypothetical protein